VGSLNFYDFRISETRLDPLFESQSKRAHTPASDY